MATLASRIALAVCLVWAVGVIGYLAFRRGLARAGHWLACAWMQCDEAKA